MPRRRIPDNARAVAREISYASSAASRGGRAMIRVMENATGRIDLIRRAQGYDAEVAQGRDFWQVIVERYGLQLKVVGGSLDLIPREGPVILIANHPYGILDGLMMGHILSTVRGDFRILANSVFLASDELAPHIVPIEFAGEGVNSRKNHGSLLRALKYVKNGGALGVFPSGTVATAARPWGVAAEPKWSSLIGSMVRASEATCIPLYFHGYNSRRFQLASHVHQTLRVALLINEFRRRTGGPVQISVGDAMPPDFFIDQSAKDISRLLRSAVVALGGVPEAVVGKQYLRFD